MVQPLPYLCLMSPRPSGEPSSMQGLLRFWSSMEGPAVKQLWCTRGGAVAFKLQLKFKKKLLSSENKQANKHSPLPWNPFQSLHSISLFSGEEGIYFTSGCTNIDLIFFFFLTWRSRHTTSSLISSYPNISKYSLSAVAPVWRALPNTIAIEVESKRERADVKKCVCWKKKRLLALKQIWTLLLSTPSMSEENFPVKMGCVSALCVNNSGEVWRNRALFCSKWHRLHFSRCR